MQYDNNALVCGDVPSVGHSGVTPSPVKVTGSKIQKGVRVPA